MKGVILRPSTFYVYFYLELVLDRVEYLTGGVCSWFPRDVLVLSSCWDDSIQQYSRSVGLFLFELYNRVLNISIRRYSLHRVKVNFTDFAGLGIL